MICGMETKIQPYALEVNMVNVSFKQNNWNKQSSCSLQII